MQYKEEDYYVYQNFDIESLDYKRADNYVLGIDLVAKAENLCFFIFDYYKNNYFHIKSYNEYLNDLSKYKENPYLFFIQNFFSEDLEYSYNIHHRAFSYVLALENFQKKDLKLYYNCRFRNKNNEYEMTDVTLQLLDTDSKGNIWLVLFTLKKSKTEFFSIPYITSANEKIEEFNLNTNILHDFTTQEKIVAISLCSIKSYDEICNDFQIKLSTLKSHINKIYNKLGINNRFNLQKLLLLK